MIFRQSSNLTNMLKNPLRPVHHGFVDKLQDLLQNPITSLLYMISAIVCLFSGYGFLAMTFLAACIYSNPVLIWKVQYQYRDVLRKYKLNGVMLSGVILGLLAGSVLGLALAEPSHAQFFNNAENFIKTNFASGSGLGGGAGGNNAAGGVISLVMNTLRLLFVMYMLFGIVQVFQAVRQGEEWKDLARTPFFVVLAGTVGDVLVGAITGTRTP
jgi:fumarate reductase subunit C